ncbi:MAG: hypothetical protein J2P26_07185 [Nocardiopsaceae bacterium]|nr:hypothetical protein [Nocardiopsaceae bacterium]
MRAAIRSGRCWVPPEWRVPIGLRFWERTAVVLVTGARTRADATEILADHLPLLPPGTPELPVPAPEITSTNGTGLPGAIAGPEAAEPGAYEDEQGARRMARRLSRLLPAKGTRDLLRAGFIPPHLPAVYAWRRARHGEHAYRAWPDGSFTPVAVFRHVHVQDRTGQWRTTLVAGRPW